MQVFGPPPPDIDNCFPSREVATFFKFACVLYRSKGRYSRLCENPQNTEKQFAAWHGGVYARYECGDQAVLALSIIAGSGQFDSPSFWWSMVKHGEAMLMQSRWKGTLGIPPSERWNKPQFFSNILLEINGKSWCTFQDILATLGMISCLFVKAQ